uniref:class I SAM-dependent methyltransferase n=1 Tax=Polynucleobacter sp. TaxID=2029855 RepID=UPI004047A6AD
MSGFSSDWLALREPVDHRSRNQGLQVKVLDYLAQAKTVYPGLLCFTDLGSGTGSNLRALAPHLHSDQHWTLVDYDAGLLHTARDAILAWGDSEIISSIVVPAINSSAPIKPLSILKQNQKIVVEFKCVDLLNDYQAILNEPADLITSAAFFDLVAESWLIKFCAALSKPLYTVLTYDGIEKWSPPEEIDEDVLKAFHQHQRTDKGFGSALGPAAAEQLQSLLRAHLFTTISVSSPWILDRQDGDLIEQLAIGTARAAREINVIPSIAVNQWEQSRQQASHCEIGHIDLFAYKV